jgi:hypothetical protein
VAAARPRDLSATRGHIPRPNLGEPCPLAGRPPLCNRTALCGRRSIRGWGAPAKFAADVLLPSTDTANPAPIGSDSGLTFERYLQLVQAELLFDGHSAWMYLTRRLELTSQLYGKAAIESAALDAWYHRRERLLQIDCEQVRLLVPPAALR